MSPSTNPYMIMFIFVLAYMTVGVFVAFICSRVKGPRDRVVAIFLPFFFGPMGAHKFYLGKTTAGIMYLIFCWTSIPSIVAFIEMIMMVFKSDEEFNKEYNPGTEPSAKVPIQNSAIKDLEALAELHRRGAITKEEFEVKKAALLKRI